MYLGTGFKSVQIGLQSCYFGSLFTFGNLTCWQSVVSCRPLRTTLCSCQGRTREKHKIEVHSRRRLMRLLSTAATARWPPFQSVEWGQTIAGISELLPSSLPRILPDLPHVFLDEQSWVQTTPRRSRILTIAACRHSYQTLEKHFCSSQERKADHFLVVGGNDKEKSSSENLTTQEVLGFLQNNAEYCTLWATANPNDPSSVRSVQEKMEAGASALVTQPILSSQAECIVNKYPEGTDLIAGLAMPETTKSLRFWQTLLGQPELSEDARFRDHLEYFSNKKCNITWARQEQQMLESMGMFSGVHYMPLKSTSCLLSLLEIGS